MIAFISTKTKQKIYFSKNKVLLELYGNDNPRSGKNVLKKM
jgi:hypothetical protein